MKRARHAPKNAITAFLGIVLFTVPVFAIAIQKPQPAQFSVNAINSSETVKSGTQNQVLAKLQINAPDDAVLISSMRLKINASGRGGRVRDISNIVLKDDQGKIVAKSRARVTAFSGTVLFRPAGSGIEGRFITFPSGSHAYTVEATLGRALLSGQVITVSTIPARDWRDIRARTKLLPVARTNLKAAVSLKATVH